MAAVLYGSTGSGEVGVLIWRRGLEVSTGTECLWGSSGLQEQQRYWYRSTDSLGFQHLGFTKKRGMQSFEGSGRRPESRGLGVSRV